MKRHHFNFSHLWGGLKSLHRLSHPPQPSSDFPPSPSLLLHPRQEHLSAAGRVRRGSRGGRSASGLPLCASIYLWLCVAGLFGEREMEDTNRCWETIHTFRSVRPKSETGTVFRRLLARRTAHWHNKIRAKANTFTLLMKWNRSCMCFVFFVADCAALRCVEMFSCSSQFTVFSLCAISAHIKKFYLNNYTNKMHFLCKWNEK